MFVCSMFFVSFLLLHEWGHGLMKGVFNTFCCVAVWSVRLVCCFRPFVGMFPLLFV